MTRFVEWVERYALPLVVRRWLYERIARKVVLGRHARVHLRAYYRLPDGG